MLKPKYQTSRINTGLLLAIAVSLQATALPAQNIPIAILDFEANGISQTEAIALTDRLRNELFRLGEFDVVERGLMEEILLEQDFQLSGCTTNDCLVEVGRLMGARQVVGGRISKIGAMFTVSARVVDVETGKLVGVSDYDLRGGLEEMLTVGMKQVAEILSGGEKTPAQPTTVDRQPLATEIPARAERRRPARYRFQIGYGIPLDFDNGQAVWASWFPLKGIPFGKLTFLPALTGGFFYAGHPLDSNYRVGYTLIGSHLRYQGQRIGLGGALALGFGLGQEYVEDYINVIKYSRDTSGLVWSLGGQVTFRLGKIHLLLDADYFVNSDLSSDYFGASRRISLGLQL